MLLPLYMRLGAWGKVAVLTLVYFACMCAANIWSNYGLMPGKRGTLVCALDGSNARTAQGSQNAYVKACPNLHPREVHAFVAARSNANCSVRKKAGDWLSFSGADVASEPDQFTNNARAGRKVYVCTSSTTQVECDAQIPW